MNETWVHIPGFEGLYMISNIGRVKSLVRGKVKKEIIMKTPINKDGYMTVGFWKNSKAHLLKVHRLVAESFLKECYFHGASVNHKDGNKVNNNLENLEWVTPAQNSKHAKELGLYATGPRNGRFKDGKHVIGAYNKICGSCKREFISKFKYRIFCSKSCSIKHRHLIESISLHPKLAI